MILRKCRDCGLEATISTDLDKFALSKASSYGRQNLCRACQYVRIVKYRASKPEKYDDIDKKYRTSVKGVVHRMYSGQVWSSIKRGHTPPSYTRDELSGWLHAQPNFKQLYDEWVDSGHSKYKKPSADRLDDDKGYSFENLRLVTWKENERSFHDKKKKQIQKLELDGTLVATFDSITEAAESIGSSHEMVSRVCRGLYGRKSHKGFLWRYK